MDDRVGIAEAQPQRDRMQPGLLVLPGVLAQELTEACGHQLNVVYLVLVLWYFILIFVLPGLAWKQLRLAVISSSLDTYFINVLGGEVINSPCTYFRKNNHPLPSLVVVVLAQEPT